MIDRLVKLASVLCVVVLSGQPAIACSYIGAGPKYTATEVYDMRNAVIDDATGIYLARVVEVAPFSVWQVNDLRARLIEDGTVIVDIGFVDYEEDYFYPQWPAILTRYSVTEVIRGSEADEVVTISAVPDGWGYATVEDSPVGLTDEQIEFNIWHNEVYLYGLGTTTFDDHSIGDFWANPGLHHTGRNSDCQPFRLFVEGQSILIFTGNETNNWNLEPIESDADLWLEYVRTRVRE